MNKISNPWSYIKKLHPHVNVNKLNEKLAIMFSLKYRFVTNSNGIRFVMHDGKFRDDVLDVDATFLDKIKNDLHTIKIVGTRIKKTFWSNFINKLGFALIKIECRDIIVDDVSIINCDGNFIPPEFLKGNYESNQA